MNTKDLKDLYNLVLSDLHESIRKGTEQDTNQYERRIFVRNLFTTFETYIELLKSELIDALDYEYSNHKYKPDIGEILILEKRKFNVGKTGEYKESNLKLSLEQKIKFTLNLYCKIYIDDKDRWKSIDQYDNFWKALEIRNRVVHPKTISDYDISDDELGVVEDAQIFFIQIIELNKSIT
ncbi:MAG: hypothetical protein GTO02_15335 [Candidatus Dadabacteria bacterium]|nr:hypothetical protein [Candidatus Dadabacteria bacterium]